MTEQNHDPLSEQSDAQNSEQKYDYIFKELEKQEMLKSGKPLLISTDGKAEQATAPKAFKVLLPMMIFIGAMILIVITAEINPMLGMTIFGMMFMGVSLWMSYVGDKKFRPEPLLILVFLIGLGTSYAAASTMIYEMNPFFDMELFKVRSVLGFGIGIAICGIAVILSDVITYTTCNMQVQAACTEIKSIGRINGRPFGTVTWQYEWDGVSYTRKTYNTIIGMLCEGTVDVIFLNPAHPERIRSSKKSSSWGWGVFYLIAGIFMIVCSVVA